MILWRYRSRPPTGFGTDFLQGVPWHSLSSVWRRAGGSGVPSTPAMLVAHRARKSFLIIEAGLGRNVLFKVRFYLLHITPPSFKLRRPLIGISQPLLKSAHRLGLLLFQVHPL